MEKIKVGDKVESRSGRFYEVVEIKRIGILVWYRLASDDPERKLWYKGVEMIDLFKLDIEQVEW